MSFKRKIEIYLITNILCFSTIAACSTQTLDIEDTSIIASNSIESTSPPMEIYGSEATTESLSSNYNISVIEYFFNKNKKNDLYAFSFPKLLEIKNDLIYLIDNNKLIVIANGLESVDLLNNDIHLNNNSRLMIHNKIMYLITDQGIFEFSDNNLGKCIYEGTPIVHFAYKNKLIFTDVNSDMTLNGLYYIDLGSHKSTLVSSLSKSGLLNGECYQGIDGTKLLYGKIKDEILYEEYYDLKTNETGVYSTVDEGELLDKAASSISNGLYGFGFEYMEDNTQHLVCYTSKTEFDTIARVDATSISVFPLKKNNETDYKVICFNENTKNIIIFYIKGGSSK